ncbi:MAG: hypothetical protein KKG47_16330 [Proteobacteria bacterium]|nr:hypothetical protein [Pseudomonadota bacterium]MBU1739690.1 hypothetical protein [Pseudomonadota bacterium]
MDEIDKVRLLAELDSECCELNHGPNTRKEDYPATDYIVLPVGYRKDEVQEITIRDLVVPVCFACAHALIGNEWTLLYCFECGESRWVCRELARNSYRHHILWLRGCPDCSNKFGGLYFTDQPEQATQLQFLIGAQKSYIVA